jgi:SAM-dependent methyltransferase
VTLESMLCSAAFAGSHGRSLSSFAPIARTRRAYACRKKQLSGGQQVNERSYSKINLSKANFDDIYGQEDPRAYFSVLGALDYMIPDIAEPIIRQIVGARAKETAAAPVVLDIGCSYGINAALHRFPLTFNMLRNRYAKRELATVRPLELARLDRNFYASWPEIGQARFIGLDMSEPAIQYARNVGLLEAGIAANLEQNPLRADDAELLRSANILLSTGCVGYVTHTTYRRVLDALDTLPWIVSFVLRMFPYDRMAAALEGYGLVTERLAGATFVQRRFRDVDEFKRSLAVLADLGVDTAGFEADGRFQAELFVSRPAADVRAAPLGEIVTVTSGRNRPVGARYVQVETGSGMEIAIEP